MQRAAEAIVAQAEAGALRGREARELDACRAEMLALQQSLERSGDATGAGFAAALLALLHQVFPPAAASLPEELRAGVLVRGA